MSDKPPPLPNPHRLSEIREWLISYADDFAPCPEGEYAREVLGIIDSYKSKWLERYALDAEIKNLKEHISAHQLRFENLTTSYRELHRDAVTDTERSAATIARLVAERERLLWLACVSYYNYNYTVHAAARRILAEHEYDEDRINRMASMPEPVVPE